MSVTTIKVSSKTRVSLERQKISDSETLEQVITRLLKNQLSDNYLDEQTRLDVQEGLDDIKAGRVHTTKEIKTELELI